MTPSQLLADTYARFRESGEWPFARSLQADYGPRVNIRALAAEMGHDKLICQSGPDGRCQLTIEGLKEIPDAADDIDMLVAAVAFLARCFELKGSVPVTDQEIGRALKASGATLTRVGALLRLTSRLWSSCSISADNSEFSFTPTEDAYFFRDIKSFADFESVRAKIEREDRRIGELLSNPFRHAYGDSTDSQTDAAASRYCLLDERLNDLLQTDLAELVQVRSIGAWKATAVLAGSCLEALLCDICNADSGQVDHAFR